MIAYQYIDSALVTVSFCSHRRNKVVLATAKMLFALGLLLPGNAASHLRVLRFTSSCVASRPRSVPVRACCVLPSSPLGCSISCLSIADAHVAMGPGLNLVPGVVCIIYCFRDSIFGLSSARSSGADEGIKTSSTLSSCSKFIIVFFPLCPRVLLKRCSSALPLLLIRSTDVRRHPFSLLAPTAAATTLSSERVLGRPPALTHSFD